jgi:hypothetical protein
LTVDVLYVAPRIFASTGKLKMETSVPARDAAARVDIAEHFIVLLPRILFALAFTLLTAYALVATENQLIQVFGPLPDADLAVVLQ